MRPLPLLDPQTFPFSQIGPRTWHDSLAEAIRDPFELLQRLELPQSLLVPSTSAVTQFPMMVPVSYVNRMRSGDPHDPLLRQVLPIGEELEPASGYSFDAVGDGDSRRAPGLLHKYHGRALLIATGACASHCRYCFRRHYPYGNEPRRMDDWEPAFSVLEEDPSIQEVLLSGGDPLMLTDLRLSEIITRLGAIAHLKRFRIHTRLPIVLPDRVTRALVDLLTSTHLTPIMVVHANHPREIAGDCEGALRELVRAGITTLNQSVLLRGVNDDAETLIDLSERLINVGVIPYYLHQLDRVQGTAHFAVEESRGSELIAELRRRLPGYAVPRYVREEAGADHKTPL